MEAISGYISAEYQTCLLYVFGHASVEACAATTLWMPASNSVCACKPAEKLRKSLKHWGLNQEVSGAR
ncbi:MAG: hypothetical protein QXP58_07995 [Thermoprotei archaeon]